MGDFYEMFFEDAEIAAAALGIVLTKRGRHQGQDIPLCGVPVHAAQDYLKKLISLAMNGDEQAARHLLLFREKGIEMKDLTRIVLVFDAIDARL